MQREKKSGGEPASDGGMLDDPPPHSGLAGGYNSKSVLVFFSKICFGHFCGNPRKTGILQKKINFFQKKKFSLKKFFFKFFFSQNLKNNFS